MSENILTLIGFVFGKTAAFRRCAFKMMCLYAERVPAAEVTRLLKKHGMERYIASWRKFHMLDFAQQWFFVKRYIYVRLPKQCR